MSAKNVFISVVGFVLVLGGIQEINTRERIASLEQSDSVRTLRTTLSTLDATFPQPVECGNVMIDWALDRVYTRLIEEKVAVANILDNDIENEDTLTKHLTSLNDEMSHYTEQLTRCEEWRWRRSHDRLSHW